MGADWRKVRVGDVADVVGGGTPRTSDPGNFGDAVPWLTPKDLAGQPPRHIGEGERSLSRHGLETSSARLLPKGTVLLSTRAPIGYVALAANPIATNQGFRCLVLKEGQIPEFWYYLLKHNRSILEAHANGTTFKELPGTTLASLAFFVPDVIEQQAIAEVLGALDDKIEANARLVPLLRNLARTRLQQAADPASSYVVGEVADVRKGLSYTGAGLADAGTPMVNLANAENYGWLKRSGFKHYTGPYKPRHVAPPGSLLVSGVEQTWRHEIIGWPILLPEDVGPALFSQDVFLLDLHAGLEWLQLPLWAHLFTVEARARLEGMVYGTTVARFPAEALTGMEFPAPSRESPVLDAAQTLLRRAWAAERESATLAALRDALLPPLLSGQLRVREADAALVEAG